MEIDAVYGDNGKKGKHVKSKEGQGQRQREAQKVNTRAARSLRATAVTVESGSTIRKTVDTRTLLQRWMRRSLLSLQTGVRSAARTESHLHLSWFEFSWNRAVDNRDDLPL